MCIVSRKWSLWKGQMWMLRFAAKKKGGRFMAPEVKVHRKRRDYLVGWSWPYHRIEVAAPEGESQGTVKVLVALDLPEDAL